MSAKQLCCVHVHCARWKYRCCCLGVDHVLGCFLFVFNLVRRLRAHFWSYSSNVTKNITQTDQNRLHVPVNWTTLVTLPRACARLFVSFVRSQWVHRHCWSDTSRGLGVLAREHMTCASSYWQWFVSQWLFFAKPVGHSHTLFMHTGCSVYSKVVLRSRVKFAWSNVSWALSSAFRATRESVTPNTRLCNVSHWVKFSTCAIFLNNSSCMCRGFHGCLYIGDASSHAYIIDHLLEQSGVGGCGAGMRDIARQVMRVPPNPLALTCARFWLTCCREDDIRPERCNQGAGCPKLIARFHPLMFTCSYSLAHVVTKKVSSLNDSNHIYVYMYYILYDIYYKTKTNMVNGCQWLVICGTSLYQMEQGQRHMERRAECVAVAKERSLEATGNSRHRFLDFFYTNLGSDAATPLARVRLDFSCRLCRRTFAGVEVRRLTLGPQKKRRTRWRVVCLFNYVHWSSHSCHVQKITP